jgi:hypothetical protein
MTVSGSAASSAVSSPRFSPRAHSNRWRASLPPAPVKSRVSRLSTFIALTQRSRPARMSLRSTTAVARPRTRLAGEASSRERTSGVGRRRVRLRAAPIVARPSSTITSSWGKEGSDPSSRRWTLPENTSPTSSLPEVRGGSRACGTFWPGASAATTTPEGSRWVGNCIRKPVMPVARVLAWMMRDSSISRASSTERNCSGDSTKACDAVAGSGVPPGTVCA